jgi:hypothetical protein
VFALKTDADGYVTRFKARSVLGGNKQVAGVDYDEVFSPAMRAEEMRMLISAAADLQGERYRGVKGAQVRVLRSADVKDAYLQSPLEEGEQPLHELPRGYVPTQTAPDGFRVVGQSVYAHPGLKQAGRAWYRLQRKQLLARGFVEYAGAPCIFYKRLDDGQFIAVGVFVDDLNKIVAQCV